MPLPTPPPLPQPPRAPVGLALSKPLLDWLTTSISTWDTELIRALHNAFTNTNSAVNTLLDSFIFQMVLVPVSGSLDGVNTRFTLPNKPPTQTPYTPRRDVMGVPQGQLVYGVGDAMSVAVQFYVPNNAPARGQWTYIDGEKVQPNPPQQLGEVIVGIPPNPGDFLAFAPIVVQ